MAYIFDQQGVMVSIPNNSPLPNGARWASDQEVADWLEADRIRAAAGLPAPKSPQQAQLEHEALEENIRKRGGLATPQEIANLNITAEQMAAAPTEPVSVPAAGSQGAARAVKTTRGTTEVAHDEVAVTHILGRGATAGDQYTQYQPVPGLEKVITEESVPNTAEPRSDNTRQVADRVESQPAARQTAAPNVPAAPNDSAAERARNSPTAKDKER